MAHIDIHYGFSVNGVAAIHTDILKNTELNAFYKLYPDKFNNKTNGVTFRRWLLSCNRPLSKLLDETIGKDYRKDADNLHFRGKGRTCLCHSKGHSDRTIEEYNRDIWKLK